MDGQSSEVTTPPPGVAADPFAPIDPDALPQEEEQYNKDEIYWALWKGKDLAQALKDKQEAYFQSARQRGLLPMWIVAYAMYHGLTPDDLRDFATQQIGFEGNELEALRFHINLIRPYARHQTSLALGEPAAFKAMVVNSDHASQAKAELADRIVTALHKRYCAKHDMPAAEGDGVFGFGATHYRWDFMGGDLVKEPLAPEVKKAAEDAAEYAGANGLPKPKPPEQKFVKSGAPVVTVHYPWTHITETKARGEHLWAIVREPDSVWNLIAQYPHLKKEILDSRTGAQNDQYDFAQLFGLEEFELANKDSCTTLHFYHARCAAAPNGRYVVMFNDVILWDGPCPRKQGLPIATLRSGTFIESTFGYADIWDLMAIQQAINQVNSDELSNYATFGRQSVALEQGTEVSIDAIARGTAFYVPSGARMPQAIQLAAIPTTLPQEKDYLHKMLDTVSGQNAASRGDPTPNVRSGEMNALLDSIAIRYQSFRQAAVRDFRIESASILLDMIERYGENPFLVEIAGIESRSYVAEYTRDDVAGVERITMDVVSPLMQSMAGRMQVFTMLKDLPPEDRNAAYEMVVTGNTSLYLKTDRACELLVRSENEDLITGRREVVVTGGDNPFRHYPKHFAQREQLLASDNPDAEALKRLDDHMIEHVQQWLGMSPLVCQLLGIPAPPALPPSPDNEFGNPTWQLMALTGGMMAPGMDPMAGAAGGGAPGGPQPAAGGGGPPAPAGAPGAQGGGAHPSGAGMPQASSPPQSAAA